MTYAEGRRAEKAKDFDRAVFDYETVLSTFPHSPLVTMHLGVAYYRNGNVPQAVMILRNLRERTIPLEVVKQVDAILAEIQKPTGVK